MGPIFYGGIKLAANVRVILKDFPQTLCIVSVGKIIWLVLSDEQMSQGWPFSLLNDEQMRNWLGVEHLPVMTPVWFPFHSFISFTSLSDKIRLRQAVQMRVVWSRFPSSPSRVFLVPQNTFLPHFVVNFSWNNIKILWFEFRIPTNMKRLIFLACVFIFHLRLPQGKKRVGIGYIWSSPISNGDHWPFLV